MLITTALEKGKHKPLCWFRYVDDKEFPDQLNNTRENMQFTMETERDCRVPFLDINIYRKPDGSLGRKDCRKPTHANLYLISNSHHHPSNKQAVVSTLMHRARSLSDQESLHSELQFLRTTFRQNGYSDRQI
jgi:hypothetical protein